MRKQAILLFAILLAFWTVLVGAVNWSLTLVGTMVALLTVWFCRIWAQGCPDCYRFGACCVWVTPSS